MANSISPTELDTEGRAYSQLRVLDVDVPAVILLDDTARQGETESPPTLTSRHPRAEDIAVHPSGDASPRVGDINVDPLIFEYVLERDLPLTSSHHWTKLSS